MTPPISSPKISIVTPSFNQGRFIRETIDSVLSQSYDNVEHCVIDGGSTDETVDILKSYGEKLNWVSEKDKGQTEAINKGLQKTTGDVVAYLNSDDVFLPGTLQTVARFFSENPNVQWLTGDYFIINEQGERIQSLVAKYKRYLRRKPSFQRLCVANFIIQPSTFWRRGLLDEVGYFDMSLHYCMDYDYWMRIIQKYPLAVLPNHFSCFRIHAASKGGSQYKKQFAEEHEIVKRYVQSRPLLALHKLHAAGIVQAYNLMK